MDKILAKTLAKTFKYLLKVAMWAKCVKCNCSENHFGKTLHLGCHVTGVTNFTFMGKQMM